MLLRVIARPWLLSVAFLSACTGSPSPSGLEQRNAPALPVSKDSPAAPANASPKTATTPTATTPAPVPTAVPAGQLTAEPPAGTELFPVRLALKDASAYQITTIGMVAFTGVKPSGFAREERVELDTCEGEGEARRCRLTHRYVHFEAEPPNGRIFEGDEKKVDKLVTRHTLRSNGARDGDVEISGPAEQQESKDGLAMREAHRFFCIRFPDAPIGVGAKWKDTCHMRTAGVIDTREVIWELTNLSTDAKGRRRADFTYLGNYSAPGEPTPRTGTVQGILYFFLDSGEPHLIKEQIVTRREPTSQFQTVTTISYQFGKFATDKKGKETVLRTDGEPFPEAPPPPPPGAPAADANMSPAP
jgi:hypothetical protein